MGFVPGAAPGTPGNFLGIRPSGPQGSDGTFDLPRAPHEGQYISLRQCTIGSVGSGSFDDSSGWHIAGVGVTDTFHDVNDMDSWGWTPSVAAFAQSTLPGSLLVCLGIIRGEPILGAAHGEYLSMDVGRTIWAPGPAPGSFNAGLAGIVQLAEVDGALAYMMNAPAVPAGVPFYGGLYGSDDLNNFLYQIILAEFECHGATQGEFSFNNTAKTGGDLSLTGRLPSDNPSFVVAITYSMGDSNVSPGDGFTLGPTSPTLGLQWQYQEFPAQPSGYPGPYQWPTSLPGISGSFQLGFIGGASGTVSIGAFVFNVLPTTAAPPPTGLGDLDQNLPNVWIIS